MSIQLVSHKILRYGSISLILGRWFGNSADQVKSYYIFPNQFTGHRRNSENCSIHLPSIHEMKYKVSTFWESIPNYEMSYQNIFFFEIWIWILNVIIKNDRIWWYTSVSVSVSVKVEKFHFISAGVINNRKKKQKKSVQWWRKIIISSIWHLDSITHDLQWHNVIINIDWRPWLTYFTQYFLVSFC